MEVGTIQNTFGGMVQLNGESGGAVFVAGYAWHAEIRTKHFHRMILPTD